MTFHGPTTLYQAIQAGISTPMLLMRAVQQVVDIVSQFHALGLVHNDIQANNILISFTDEAPWVRSTVIDMGAVTLKGRRPYMGMGFRWKDFPYFSPELVTGGKVTPASDVYSLGWVIKDVLLRFPQSSPIRSGMKKDVLRCLHRNPYFRPTITRLQTQMAKFVDT